MPRILPLLALVIALLPASGQAIDHQAHGQHQPYAGMVDRAIKSLSPSDIEALEQGRGWGLALPAELNSYPGPLHLLELADKLGLSEDQRAAITRLRQEMLAQAIPTGRKLIAAEAAISHAFASGEVTEASLTELLANAAALRAELRHTHLVAHLKAKPLLTEPQISLYNQLRGYRDDPCAATPAGHDPAMWRKHNGCE